MLPAGEQAIEVISPLQARSIRQTFGGGPNGPDTDSATFTCAGGERLYLAVGTTAPPGKWFPIALTPIDRATTRPLIANMAMVLPPRRIDTPAD